MAKYNRDISEVIFLLYNNTPEYKEIQQTLTDIHLKTNYLFQTINKDISEISKNTKQWENYFKNLNEIVEEINEAKKVYQHYEDKLMHMEDRYSKDDRLNENRIKRKLERVIFYNSRISKNSDLREMSILIEPNLLTII